jgi:CheY-like chemotaxis protein
MTKIAVIDDNLVFRKLTKMLLNKLGISETDILLFKNGNEIYEFICGKIDAIEDLPTILFLDLNMPIMDGWEFLKLFKLFKKEHNYNPEIYILTSSVNDKDHKKAKKFVSIKDYLTKPINEDILKNIIIKQQNIA